MKPKYYYKKRQRKDGRKDGRTLAPKHLVLKQFAIQYLQPYKGRIALAAIGLVIFSLTAFAQVRLLEPILDKGFSVDGGVTIYWLMVFMFSFSLLRALAYYLQISQSGYVGSAIFRDLQKTLYRHLISNDVYFMQSESTGKYVSLMIANMHMIRNSLSRLFITLLRDSVLVVAYLFNMFYTDWRLSLITFIFIALIYLPVRWLSKITRHAATQTQQKIGETGTFLDETFKGIRLLKAYNAEKKYLKLADKYFEALFFWNKRTSYSQAKAMPIVEVLVGLSFACVVLVGGLQIRAGELSIGGVMSFVVALLLLLQPVRTLVNLNVDLQESIAALNNFYKTLQRKANIIDKPRAKKLVVKNGDITLRNVSFAYQEEISTRGVGKGLSKEVGEEAGEEVSKGVGEGGDKRKKIISQKNNNPETFINTPPALNNLSLKVKGGSKVAIVGASGAGKSTLLNVLLRFYDIDSGEVEIDGQNIADCTMQSVREKIAFVSQDIGIFNDTLRANIALGEEQVDEKKMRKVVEEAEAKKIIEDLPNGLDTEVGEKGFRLSGGQLQRIALARALYKDAPIVLLDEATAALDNETERLLQKTLDRVMKGRTVITIAHRLTTILNADKIFVMEKGKCSESGTHDSLLRKKGIYAQLWSRISEHS